MTKTSVTFMCEDTIHAKIQELAEKSFDGNFSQALRNILKDWSV